MRTLIGWHSLLYQRTEHRLMTLSWLLNLCFVILTNMTQIKHPCDSLWRAQQMLLHWSWLCRSWLTNCTLFQYTMIQDFKSCDHKDFKCQLNTCLIIPLWQISKTSPLQFSVCFRWIEKIFFKITKFNFEITIWKPALILAAQFIKISTFHVLVVSDIFWQVIISSDSQWRPKNPSVCPQTWEVKWVVFKIQGFVC